jgi:hypothetical protein
MSSDDEEFQSESPSISEAVEVPEEDVEMEDALAGDEEPSDAIDLDGDEDEMEDEEDSSFRDSDDDSGSDSDMEPVALVGDNQCVWQPKSATGFFGTKN